METLKNISKYILIPASLMSLIEVGRIASNGQHEINGLAIGAFIVIAIISSALWSSESETEAVKG